MSRLVAAVVGTLASTTLAGAQAIFASSADVGITGGVVVALGQTALGDNQAKPGTALLSKSKMSCGRLPPAS